MGRPTNKARREEVAKLKHQRRCGALGISPEKWYRYKSTTKPCSCYLCRAEKEKMSFKHHRDIQKLFVEPFLANHHRQWNA